MGDSGTKMIDPFNMAGTQTKSSNLYMDQLPDFLKTDPAIQKSFQTPTYRSALSNFYQQPFEDVQSNIRNWMLAKVPKVKTKIGVKRTPVSSPFGTLTGGMIPGFKPF